MSSPNEIRIVKNRDAWRRHGWTATPNALLLRSDISWEAKGAFGWLSLAADDPEFDVTAASLAAAGPKGRDHAQNMVRELEQHGFLTRSRVPDPNGTPVLVYELYPLPVDAEHNTYTPSTAKKRSRSKSTSLLVSPGKLTGQAFGADQESVDNSISAQPSSEHAPKGSANVSAGQARKTGTPVPGTPVPGTPGVLTTSPESTLSLSRSPSPTEPVHERSEGARENASLTETPEPAEWAVALIAELDFGQHRRPGRKRAAELAQRVERAHAGGLSERDIRKHCRAALAQARRNASAYLLGALADDELPLPSQASLSNSPAATGMPDWCGQCERDDRRIEIDGRVHRCPSCHPKATTAC